MGAEKIDCRLDLRGKVCPGPTFDTRMTLNEKEVTISLVGEGVYLTKETIAKTVHGVGFPPLPDLIDKVVKVNVPVFV